MTRLSSDYWQRAGEDYTPENPAPEEVMQRFTLGQAQMLKAHNLQPGYYEAGTDCPHYAGVDKSGWTDDDFEDFREDLVYDKEVHFMSWDGDECCYELRSGTVCADCENEDCEHVDRLYWEREEFYPRMNGEYREDEEEKTK